MNRQKGSDFERHVCRLLSLWFSGCQREDLFWRTSMSGGRATVRRKQGKETSMQYGDITAVDEAGAALVRVMTIEVKRGYGKACPFDLLDSNATKSLEWLLFLKQVKAAQLASRTPHWAVIFQRDRRLPCIAFPYAMWQNRPLSFEDDPPRILVRAADEDFIVMTLEGFFSRFEADWFHKQADLLK